MLASLNILDFIFSSILSVGRAAFPAQGFGGAAHSVAGMSMTDVSGALYQRGRHEAGMSRRAAARNV